MSLWVKICGNTTLEDALLAAEAGADAVGFVFAPSPRRVTVEQVAAITPHLPAAVEKIGVFVDTSVKTIEAAVRGAGLTGVQLHFAVGAEVRARLRERLGPGVRILQVVHFGASNAATMLKGLAVDPHVDGVLLDSRTAGAVGGTGTSFDWAEARRTVFGGDAGLRLVAAGGLNPENVAEAVATLRPWGVDAVSGVEAAPGRKDAGLVREFVERARGVLA